MRKVLSFVMVVLSAAVSAGFVACSDDEEEDVFKEIDPVNIYNIRDGYEYVDLELPSGTLWATYNVDAASPADYGSYFAWGETKTKAVYSWKTYTLCDNGSYTSLNKYCIHGSYGTVDNKKFLEPDDDAATVHWGEKWRMPTTKEQHELLNTDYCTWTWTIMKNTKGDTIRGYEIKSKLNGKSIFLPAAGMMADSPIVVNECGCYWSSSLGLNDPKPYYAYSLNFYSNYMDGYSIDRYYGRSVRPVHASPEYIDLGLPSGTLWASHNVGAEYPADYGDYFAWGETEPVDNYGWETYKWCYGSFNTLCKYVPESKKDIYGYSYCEICKESFHHSDVPEDNHEYTPIHFFDDKTQLELEDDAAYIHWGSNWRMPTQKEMKELTNSEYCTWIWTTKINSKGESVYGYKVISNINGNFIFLPATGYNDEDSFLAGYDGYYWTSSLYTQDSSKAFYLDFEAGCGMCNYKCRIHGMSVRPVRVTKSK